MNAAVHVEREDKQVKQHYYVTSSQKLSHTSCVLSCSLVYLGRAQRAPHLWMKRKFVYIFIYIFIYLYTYIWYVRIPYIHPAPFVRDAKFPHCMFVHVTTVAQEKTSRTERLNSGKQRNRNLKTVRKGRHYYLDGG